MADTDIFFGEDSLDQFMAFDNDAAINLDRSLSLSLPLMTVIALFGSFDFCFGHQFH
ncbi:predicted protein [Arabidopsis lyrata subsp. lyrata]|uniref:Predicted protein n=1 Tax=Arabidopsis lyrata subsp. lyrata TaxID=81972 RepID=D7LIK1_ARALL|nr:predicted protein [Arabidopsis lyrata subsp. lyrata]